MTDYVYKALNEHGRIVRGRLEAGGEAELELGLKQMRLELLSTRVARGWPDLIRNRVRRSDLILFYFNLEQLFSAGTPLLECLTDLRQGIDNPRLAGVVAGMSAAIENGKNLSQAMSMHPSIFDPIAVSLIQVGEDSGNLSEIFGQLADSLKWQDEIARAGNRMMLYPVFVGITVIGITAFLMVYLVPQLTAFIIDMGETIPLQTRLLISASRLVTEFWPILLTAPVILYILLRIVLAGDSRLRYQLDALRLSLPLLGEIRRKLILARFSGTFALMYGAGISILESLSHLAGLSGNRVISACMEQVRQDIEAGKPMTASFRDANLFPPLVVRMIAVGESTGRLDVALRNVAYFYERDVREAIGKIQTLIEPALTVVLGLLLGWVMLAILSPIYDIVGKVRI